MNQFIILASLLVSSVCFAGMKYDYKTGNYYMTSEDSNGDTRIRGNNVNTGSTWTTTIKRNGDQEGTDSNGNRWKQDGQTNTYTNFGTGKRCTGSGFSRICTGGN